MQENVPLGKLGKYELLEKIGEGGFGTVYRGRDTLLDRPVAIKILNGYLSVAPEFVERFRREARLAANLHHPNIVSVMDVGEEHGAYYLVMDYLPGRSLKERMEKGKPWPLERVVQLLHPLAEALDYAHIQQLLHRDIKPANIMFAEDNHPLITDFGLVKSTTEESVTTTGMVLGTAEYMSPEQILGRALTPACDIYALGIIAYQLLTGALPFTGKTPFEIQQGHTTKPLPDPRRINPKLPPGAAKALAKVLAKQPDQRYPNASLFVEQLKKAAPAQFDPNTSKQIGIANRLMERGEFETAVKGLEETLAKTPTVQVTELLDECKRRQAIWLQVQSLQQDRSKTAEQLESMMNVEPWIKHIMNDPTAQKPTSGKRVSFIKLMYWLFILALLIGLGVTMDFWSQEIIRAYTSGQISLDSAGYIPLNGFYYSLLLCSIVIAMRGYWPTRASDWIGSTPNRRVVWFIVLIGSKIFLTWLIGGLLTTVYDNLGYFALAVPPLLPIGLAILCLIALEKIWGGLRWLSRLIIGSRKA